MRPLERFPTRKAKRGPEYTLLADARRAGILGTAQKDSFFFEEPRLLTGFPDLVISVRDPAYSGNRPSRALTTQHFRVLSHIYTKSKNHRWNEVSKDLLIPPNILKRTLNDLNSYNLLAFREETLTPFPLNQVFCVSKIIAIEAKMKDWRKAIQQAVANTWFCSESYILVPRLRNLDLACTEAAQAGIGVLTSNGSEVQKIVDPVILEIPSSFASWMINEWSIP